MKNVQDLLHAAWCDEITQHRVLTMELSQCHNCMEVTDEMHVKYIFLFIPDKQ